MESNRFSKVAQGMDVSPKDFKEGGQVLKEKDTNDQMRWYGEKEVFYSV